MPSATHDEPEDRALVRILDLAEDYSFGGMFRVLRARLQYRKFDGRMSEEITRINFERGNSVGVLLFDPEEDVVILTRQFRYPVFASIDPKTAQGSGAEQAWMLEVVAGIIDPATSAVETASKELLEEAGYGLPADLRPITMIYPSPGGTSEQIILFLGLVTQKDRVSQGGGLPLKGEDIQVERLPFREAMTKIDRGEIRDAKTIIALQYLALHKLHGGEF
jgi:nudix-type nucleoside diphosphatase (YffH/AdpP family)